MSSSRALATSLVLALLAAVAAAGPPQAEKLYTLDDLGGWAGAVAFDPAGQMLAVAHANDIRLVNAQTGDTRRELAGHANRVAALAFSADGRLASGGFDQAARLWPADRHADPLVLTGHRGAVMTVAFNPDATELLTGGIDGTIRVWDASDGQLASAHSAHRSWVNHLAFDRAGSRLATASSDGTAKLWNPRVFVGDSAGPPPQRPLLKTFDAAQRDGEVRAVALDPDARWLAAGTRYGIVRVWDTATGQPLAALAAQPADVWSLAVSPDGRLLAAGGSEWKRPGDVTLWDTKSWRELARLGHEGEVLSLAFSPDGRLLACGSWNNALTVWRIHFTAEE